MAKNSFTKFFIERDIFGKPITVLYNGSEAYKTKLGAVCTILVILLSLVNIIILTKGFLDSSNQKESTQFLRLDRRNSGKFYLTEN